MTERKFILKDPSLISCTEPCGEEFTLLVEGDKIKELGGMTSTKRCIAAGAPLRGQHFALKEGHTQKPNACRICTIYTSYTSFDKVSDQA